MKSKMSRSKKSYNFEHDITRAFLHMVLGISMLVLLNAHIINGFQIFILIILFGIVSLIYKRHKIPIISFFFENYERPEVLKTFPGKGLITLLTGILLAYELYPFDIAAVSIIVISLLDPMSRVFGMSFGRTINILDPKKKKYIEGHIVGGIASFLVSMIFVSPIESFLAAIIGIISESVVVEMNGESIDDNILVPLAVGASLVVFRMYV